MTEARAPGRLERTILDRIAALLVASGVPLTAVRCDVEHHDHDLVVRLGIAARVDRALERSITLRVLEALHTSGSRFGRVSVQVNADRFEGGPSTGTDSRSGT